MNDRLVLGRSVHGRVDRARHVPAARSTVVHRQGLMSSCVGSLVLVGAGSLLISVGSLLVSAGSMVLVGNWSVVVSVVSVVSAVSNRSVLSRSERSRLCLMSQTNSPPLSTVGLEYLPQATADSSTASTSRAADAR